MELWNLVFKYSLARTDKMLERIHRKMDGLKADAAAFDQEFIGIIK